MIRILRLAAVLLLLAPAALAAQPSECMDEARTQLDMNACAADEVGLADSVLNVVYRRVVAQMDTAQLPFLREAQRAWIRLRDADCGLEAAEFAGGSIRPMVEMMCLARETRRRTAHLRRLMPATAEVAAEARSGVLQAADALFQAMHDRDAAALDTLLHPRAQIVAVSERGVGVRTAAEWIPTVAQSAEVLRERMWDTQIEIDGDLATLWAPYDFHRGDRFSHCGTDAFQFVRVNGAWKLISVAFTVRTTGCGTAP
jgi:uncharacterized protein YecT (DUF1311 family)